ncbi:hypothetical protein [Pseudomarimonas arenosa]|uniref:Uncharacterized protein n=1 Tax=Pseudomarimonas arenosa TaxID=2774145 RepID=A0AAW3ZGS8_9GAMM|nr:hypothetical protein [Pseudomarimonas arenosa]MBD8524352.1 hypothetical protein [Pseudomarimonas arenosa]
MDDSAYIASRLGPGGAMVTGAVGFTLLYAVLPMALLKWTAAHNAKMVESMATELSGLFDQMIWIRVIGPMQWAGVAVLLVCTAIAIWKLLSELDLAGEDISLMSTLAKLLARFFH